MKIALLCGGPSLERGISLNSARTVLDHLESGGLEIVPVYFDYRKKPFAISPASLYSNTPSDFDFKLSQTAKALSNTDLVKLLKSCDLTFPVMHGSFGEDGQIQSFLEKHKIPFLGSDALACKRVFDKYVANELIAEKGFFTLPSAVLKIHREDEQEAIIKDFFTDHNLERAIIKPATGGSSIGVFDVASPEEALEKARLLFSKRMDTRVVIEPFCTGVEFTVIILENRFGMPVAIMPTEIESYYKKNQIFDYRKKYLPTGQVRYHCPPRFSNEVIEKIQVQAQQLFKVLKMRDFARFDGWLMDDGNLWFSDFNPISGMEQNSFLFQQSARIGLSHSDLLRYLVKNAARRYNLEFSPLKTASVKPERKLVNVLFGGQTSERQVSLMSGTNAWLKLRRSAVYKAEPFLLDLDNNVWHLPYALTLNHTVEEIQENAQNAEADEKRLRFLEEKVRLRLALRKGEANEDFFLPRKLTIKELVAQSDNVFLALHGGDGENGELQRMLDEAGVRYNGPDALCSEICMDKYLTGQKILELGDSEIQTANKESYDYLEIADLSGPELLRFYRDLARRLDSKSIIVKPQDDGCSSGIVRLYLAEDLGKYLLLLKTGSRSIQPGTFKNQEGIIEMPSKTPEKLLFEKFVITDIVRVKGNRIKWTTKTNWVEVTIGVIEQKGKIKALSPSLTVAEGAVLSVEEKFQGGTGINITPPTEDQVGSEVITKVKASIEKVAKALGIRGYSRIDAFINITSGEIIVIEVNTLPALTPSTVLFHQGLAENPPLRPRQLLELLVENKYDFE